MSASTEDSRRKAKLVKEAARELSLRPAMPSLGKTNKMLKGVVVEKKNPGKKMMKIGAALILMPDPVTGAAGVPLVLLGKAITSRTGTNIKGVYDELQKTLKGLSSL